MELAARFQVTTPFTEGERFTLQSIGSISRYSAGSTLLSAGDDTDFALLIQKGHVKVVVPGPPRRIVGLRGAGEIVGEMAAIRQKPRSASIIAIDNVEALFLPAAKWLQFLFDNPRAALAQLYIADERLAEATRKSAESILGSEQKLAKAIVELESSGLGIRTDEGIRLGFGQQDLADIAGVGLDSVKQVIRQFKNHGIIKTGRQATIVQDIGTLRRIARGDSTASS
jgi:CRP-like cAMP-binding protein